MSTEQGILWYAPDPRCIIDLNHFHISRRLARKYRQGVFTIKLDTAWDKVLYHCADRQETWISVEIKQVYTELYKLGFAHSIEAFSKDELVGGLYGVSIGGAFMAESMFHLATDASKICLIYLVEHLIKQGYVLLDVQYCTAHLSRFGAKLIPAEEYLEKLAQAITLERHFY